VLFRSHPSKQKAEQTQRSNFQSISQSYDVFLFSSDGKQWRLSADEFANLKRAEFDRAGSRLALINKETGVRIYLPGPDFCLLPIGSQAQNRGTPSHVDEFLGKKYNFADINMQTSDEYCDIRDTSLDSLGGLEYVRSREHIRKSFEPLIRGGEVLGRFSQGAPEIRENIGPFERWHIGEQFLPDGTRNWDYRENVPPSHLQTGGSILVKAFYFEGMRAEEVPARLSELGYTLDRPLQIFAFLPPGEDAPGPCYKFIVVYLEFKDRDGNRLLSNAMGRAFEDRFIGDNDHLGMMFFDFGYPVWSFPLIQGQSATSYSVERSFGQTEIRRTASGDSTVVTMPCISYSSPVNPPPQTPVKPVKLGLKAPYPNPFNGLTLIDAEWKARSAAFLTVYNALGEKVEQKDLGLSGSARFNFNGADLPSGIYFFHLVDENGNSIGKPVKGVLVK
jgi:hypothetical protein